MAKTDFRTAEDYLASLPEDQRAVLAEVRAAILAGVPEGAEEVISYQIPAVKHHGFVLYYSAHTKHFSLSCPPPSAAFTEFSDELARYKQSKSAVQFPYSEPVPADLITRMARHQAEHNEAREHGG
ncbi:MULTISPECIES: iron chaperone [unclassified Nocardioides]|uniref:iron chaperone n=1 Tax=unclassified Nocardioides TaxID=2615069 RepID=UPI0036107FF7